jgi:hypothetical protein
MELKREQKEDYQKNYQQRMLEYNSKVKETIVLKTSRNSVAPSPLNKSIEKKIKVNENRNKSTLR